MHIKKQNLKPKPAPLFTQKGTLCFQKPLPKCHTKYQSPHYLQTCFIYTSSVCTQLFKQDAEFGQGVLYLWKKSQIPRSKADLK